MEYEVLIRFILQSFRRINMLQQKSSIALISVSMAAHTCRWLYLVTSFFQILRGYLWCLCLDDDYTGGVVILFVCLVVFLNVCFWQPTESQSISSQLEALNVAKCSGSTTIYMRWSSQRGLHVLVFFPDPLDYIAK